MSEAAGRAQLSVGQNTVTYLPDGYGWLNPSVLFPASDGGGWQPHDPYLRADGRFPVSIGSFLIRTPDRVILVDLGLGTVGFEIPGLAEFCGGELLTNLAAEGLTADDIDTVVFTHLHHDHVGWTSNVAPAPNAEAGRRVTGLTFSRARHLTARAEWEHWLGTDEVTGPNPLAVQAPLADNIAFIADGESIAPGVHALATPGHTPGHLSFVVEDPSTQEAGRILILGDVMHSQVQVIESHWSFLFDENPEQAIATRAQLLKQSEEPGTTIAGGHFADHVFGRVLASAPRRAFASDRNPGAE
jgi:glyoxylase-like metal-dependent hydrolase (beta-lactamase superfamily II)